jgi:signal transduction histidine kinase
MSTAGMEPAGSPVTRKFVTGSVVGVLVLAAATVVAIPGAVRGILSTGFLPHAFCYLNDAKLIALHVGTDTAIWLSYVAISCTLVYLVWRTRREVPFHWMFLAFGAFIVACGFTHLMEVVVLWRPLYWLSGDVKLVTAVASVVTAIALPGLIPQVHEMVTAARLSEMRRLQLEKANAELRHLSARVMNTQDDERRRIARELHDGIGQYLVAIKMGCGVAHEQLKRADGRSSLQDPLELLDQCMAEVRTMSHLLHPPLLEEMGLQSALSWYVQGFMERSGIRVELDAPEVIGRLPEPVELALFRVLQESLTNIHRHAESKLAKVQLKIEDGWARLTIEDQGKGMEPGNGNSARAGVGIAGMRERVRELGGDLTVDFGSSGTKVEAVLPLEWAAVR